MNVLLFLAVWALSSYWIVEILAKKLVNLPKDWATVTAGVLLGLWPASCLYMTAEIF